MLKLLEDNNLSNIGLHDLRYTYTTLLVNNYDLKAVSELLGYASTILHLMFILIKIG